MQVLVELVAEHLGQQIATDEDEADSLEHVSVITAGGKIVSGMEHIRRLVLVDQKPIGRTPRSNLATYTGLFYDVRTFANRLCPRPVTMQDDFPSMYPKDAATLAGAKVLSWWNCFFYPVCIHPAQHVMASVTTLTPCRVKYRDKNIAKDVLGMTVDAAFEFFAG